MWIAKKHISLKNLSKNKRAILREIQRIFTESPEEMQTQGYLDVLLQEFYAQPKITAENIGRAKAITGTGFISKSVATQRYIDETAYYNIMQNLSDFIFYNSKKIRERAKSLYSVFRGLQTKYGIKGLLQLIDNLPSDLRNSCYNLNAIPSASERLEIISDAITIMSYQVDNGEFDFNDIEDYEEY